MQEAGGGTGRKIALVGSAPSSIRLAPFSDPSWQIWGCSPGAYGIVPRSDAWFELHRWEPPAAGKPLDHNVPWFSPEYCQFLREYPGVVFTTVPIDEIKNHQPYPFVQMLAKYGPYHFTSTIAWMLALAIEQKPEAIGLWGIDMAATEEYGFQRPGCQHFIGLAMSQGIEIILPPESDLMRPTTLYGLSEYNPRQIKLLARQRELQGRLANCNATLANAQKEQMFLQGALDNLNYIFTTWVDEVPEDLRFAISDARQGNPALSVHQKNIFIPGAE